jgi:toxin ParE1/3/4
VARLIWTEPALNDLKEIAAFIAKDSPTYARRFGHRLREAPKRLKLFPHLGSVVPEFDRPTLRELLVEPYRIVYEIREDDCYVLAVVHGSRNLTKAFRPPETG